ncbi:hypothetical protein [Akkermansia sp.]|uniref:hypothetical protein n=1 Tax=Akkermansia sp. TaxID=1872421 RepID=UPI0025C0BE97|nr:hypothetical protein [Akkermansia sp.]MCD8272913.1 hypothetical protein [Akkermansia sp.]
MGSLYPGTGNFTPIVGKSDSRRRARAIQKHWRPFLPSVCLNPADVKSWCINFSHHRNFRAKNLASVMITDTFLFRKPNCYQQETFRKHWMAAAWGRWPQSGTRPIWRRASNKTQTALAPGNLRQPARP